MTTKTTYGGIRRFRLDRQEDPTGVSGTGCVAQGVVFSDGTTVVRWMGDHPTTTTHPSIESVEHIHCHEGRTKIRWQDAICFQCGATTLSDDAVGCDQCGACWSGLPFMETRPDPSLASWKPALTINKATE
jgi:hypothetical protein